METWDLLPPEQKAIKKGARGCLDALTIDGAAAEEGKRNGSLSVAWIDYQKAYDCISRAWIGDALGAIKAAKLLQQTIQEIIPLWSTEHICAERGVVRVPIKMERGLYQGDSLSPLLFWLCVEEECRLPPRISWCTTNPPNVRR